jgi:hypothetical protein
MRQRRMKIGDLVEILSSIEDSIWGIIVPSDADTIWSSTRYVDVYILQGYLKGETHQFEKDQIEVISSAA